MVKRYSTDLESWVSIRDDLDPVLSVNGEEIEQDEIHFLELPKGGTRWLLREESDNEDGCS
ncbi:MAG: hypothetical protein A2Z14_13730 [Chloroflexi bacterium RBG_16_48_8]|nr:MAG: hypothetical protein A2Z14_13730 [Chloroflexi bacterium RBG_16_48_8]